MTKVKNLNHVAHKCIIDPKTVRIINNGDGTVVKAHCKHCKKIIFNYSK